MSLDDLDKRIIQCLSTGASSYQEIAKICNVTRNTVYRRVITLQNRGIIRATTSCIINFDKLNIIPIIVGAKVSQKDQDQLLQSLRNLSSIKMMWQSYGDLDLNLIAFCLRGEEGELIRKIRIAFESINCQKIFISIGFSWVKSELSPFESPQTYCILPAENMIQKIS